MIRFRQQPLVSLGERGFEKSRGSPGNSFAGRGNNSDLSRSRCKAREILRNRAGRLVRRRWAFFNGLLGKEALVPACVRLHLLTPRGMLQERIDIEVGDGLRLDKLLGRLDKMGKPERGFFRAVRKGRQGVTLLLNGDRLDIAEARKTVIREGDELAILSPISGG